MNKDELCEEPKEMSCEGEGVVSGCKSDVKREGEKNSKRKAKKRG